MDSSRFSNSVERKIIRGFSGFRPIKSGEICCNEAHVGISPLLDRAVETRQHLIEVCQYFDGYPKISADGKFSLGLNRVAPDLGALPVVSETHLTRRPQFTPEDWSAARNATRTVFTNAEDEYKEDATPPWRDSGVREIIGEPSALTLQRPWITRPNLAASLNRSAGLLASMPKQKGRLHLRRVGTLFEDLVPGALFKLNYASRNMTGLVMRVTDRTLPALHAPEFDISFIVDRSYLFATPPPFIAQAPKPGEDEPTQPLFVRVVELPLALCPEGALSLAVLYARENEITGGYGIWLEKNYAFDGAPTESFELIAASTSMAQSGVLLSQLDAGQTLDEIGVMIAIDGADQSFDEQTPWDAVADDLLIFVGDEILSVHEIEVVGPGVYRFFTLRGRMATKQESHEAGGRAFIIGRREIEPLQHPHFEPFHTAGFKVVPSNLDAADIDPIDFEITGAIYKATPVTNLRVNGALTGASYGTGESIEITWTLTDARRDLFQRRLLRIETVLEFLSEADALLGTETVADDLEILTLNNAELIALLGSEITFKVRVKTRIDSDFWQLESAAIELPVTLS